MAEPTQFFTRSRALPFVEMRRANRSSACYDKHSHDEFSFGVIDEGAASYLNLNQRHAIAKGDTVTINPGDTHSCNPQAGSWSYRMLFVDTRWIAGLQQELCTSADDYRPFEQDYERDPQRFRRFDALFQALIRDDDPLAAESELIDWLTPLFNPSGITERRDTGLGSLIPVRELLLDRLDENLPLEMLCATSGLNRYQLIRSFQRHYGMAPHAWLLDQRIKRAKQLLREGTALIDTAQRLGFSDQAHFQRHFKRRTAVTPGQYQACFV
ncbi:AraC family transcriptional regulator [Marinobacterium zhoushanense]|uniref:AraC family transcriptional regulator n=1 Tax=Marinobacterium zhoushanense TaxID=1679163 RepID=A0ABQ1K6I8_9GAMM|nr:AraC family transcriptional regulator [Marinobacterium zhoushanense]GGB84997.1 AraC family transcriptional regulator [Marinobacterium zhoushanense]